MNDHSLLMNTATGNIYEVVSASEWSVIVSVNDDTDRAVVRWIRGETYATRNGTRYTICGRQDLTRAERLALPNAQVG